MPFLPTTLIILVKIPESSHKLIHIATTLANSLFVPYCTKNESLPFPISILPFFSTKKHPLILRGVLTPNNNYGQT